MKLTFIGSGSAFTVGADNFQSNMILEENGNNLLIDCGSDAKISLHELGYSYKDIKNIYISHLHSDHVGGLEWLAFTNFFDPTSTKPNLYIAENLADELWNNVLSGGLKSIQGVSATLSTFFKLKKVKANTSFTWEKTHFNIVQTVHVMSEYSVIPSYGLIFNANGVNVFITTDTQYCPHQIMDFYKRADVIFQDCETSIIPSGVHAHYNELCSLDYSIRKKMWLYHYNPGPLPNYKKEGFKGFVKKGQVFDFSDPSTF